MSIDPVKLRFNRFSVDSESPGEPVYGQSTYTIDDGSMYIIKIGSLWHVCVPSATASFHPKRYEAFAVSGLGNAPFDTLREARAALSVFLHQEQIV